MTPKEYADRLFADLLKEKGEGFILLAIKNYKQGLQDAKTYQERARLKKLLYNLLNS